jgi:hypothetical protein
MGPASGKSAMSQEPQGLLRLGFRGDAFRGGRVPITIVAEKLQALQNVVYHAAATVSGDGRGRRGPWVNRYPFAELTFAAAHRSDLEIEASLPGSPRGEQAIELIFRMARASEQEADLHPLADSREARVWMLKSLQTLCPGPGDNYELALTCGPSAEQQIVLSEGLRQGLRRRIVEETSWHRTGEDEETVVGVLTKVHVRTAPQFIAVLRARAEVTCYFDEALTDQIVNLVAGSTVEVTGWPELDAEGRLKQLNAISDATPVSMDPLRMTRFEHDGKTYRLREPLVVSVEYTDGLWIYTNDLMNLWGQGVRREDAIRELNAAFDYLWREIAQEDDAVLDAVAQGVKLKLLSLVEQEASGG